MARYTKRIQLPLTPGQVKGLKAAARAKGVAVTALVRGLIDWMLGGGR